jgi:hypothetical protein
MGPGGRLAWGFAGLVAAWLTHRIIQRPGTLDLLKRAAAGRPLLAATGVCAGLALLGVGAAWSSARYVEQSVHRRYAAARNDHLPHGCWGMTPAVTPSEAEALSEAKGRGRELDACAFGDRSSTTTIALLGDSHASHWLGGLERAGKSHGWRVESYVMGACPVADLRGMLSGAAERYYRGCARFQEETWRRLASERPQAVILSNADNYMDAEPMGVSEAVWTSALRRTYSRLVEMGIEVIVLRDVPLVPFDVPSCLSRRAARLPLAGDCSFVEDRAFKARARRAQDNAARGLGVRFVDLNDLICGVTLNEVKGRCLTERDGMILYSDDDHLTASFARSLAPVLGERLEVALRR